jgi:penicillin-binding protein 1C
MESALSRSLNIPFVRLLRGVGLGQFVETLKKMGSFNLDAQRLTMGLSAALGVYMSPVELATVYLSLARGGRVSEVSWRKGAESSVKEEQILSEGAVWLTKRALQRRDRPDFPHRKNYVSTDPGIAWKTGTSVGHHDAWSAGWSETHVAVVWTGNLDNEPTVRLIGSKASAPIMFDILESLSEGVFAKSEPPRTLIPIEVCAYSGHVPDKSCPVRKTALAISDRIPTRSCPYHLDVEVERSSGLRVAPGCRSGRETEKIGVLRLPSSVQRWMNNVGSSIPKLAEGCEEFSSVPVRDGELQIQSPRAGQIIMLIKGISPKFQQLSLFADYPDPNSSLKWFVDGVYVGEAAANEQLWWTPKPGAHRLEVRDELGHFSKIQLEVREAWR